MHVYMHFNNKLKKNILSIEHRNSDYVFTIEFARYTGGPIRHLTNAVNPVNI